MTDSFSIKKRVIVLDCETNGLGNGHEVACLYFLQKTTEGRVNPLQTMKEIIKKVFKDVAPKTDMSATRQEEILLAFDKIKFTNVHGMKTSRTCGPLIKQDSNPY